LEILTKIIEKIKSSKNPQELWDILTAQEMTTRENIIKATNEDFVTMKIPLSIKNALKEWAAPSGICLNLFHENPLSSFSTLMYLLVWCWLEASYTRTCHFRVFVIQRTNTCL
jgi:hypothetical protein